MALLCVVTQSYLIIQNMFQVTSTPLLTFSHPSTPFQGLIWFIMPIMMVIINDVMAYMFGFFMGRTPLIQLSPKKTWEGFIGGGISTVFMSLGLAYIMCQVSERWEVTPQILIIFLSPVPVLCLPYRLQHRPGEDDDGLRAERRVPAPGVLSAPDRHHLAQDPRDEGDSHLLPLLHTLLLHVTLCIHYRALRWILCLRLQEGFQDQRLR